MNIEATNVILLIALATCVAGCACSAYAMLRWHKLGASAFRALMCNLALSAFWVVASWAMVARQVEQRHSEEQMVFLALAGAAGMFVYAVCNVVFAVLAGRSPVAK